MGLVCAALDVAWAACSGRCCVVAPLRPFSSRRDSSASARPGRPPLLPHPPPHTTTTRLCTSDGMPCHLLRDAAVDVWGCLTAINCAVCDGQQRAWPRRSAAVCRPAVRPPHKTLNAMPTGRAQPSWRLSYSRAAWGRANRELTRAVEQGCCQHSRNETYQKETAGRMAVRRRGKPHNRRPEPLKGAERGRKRAAYKKCLARGARVRKRDQAKRKGRKQKHAAVTRAAASSARSPAAASARKGGREKRDAQKDGAGERALLLAGSVLLCSR